jgi:hypothetical protein
VPWFQTREESALCEPGWHVQKDAGTNNPRYEYIGDGSMSSVQGRLVEGTPPQNNMGTLVYVNPDVNQGPRRISMIYGNGSLPLQSRTGECASSASPTERSIALNRPSGAPAPARRFRVSSAARARMGRRAVPPAEPVPAFHKPILLRDVETADPGAAGAAACV